MRRIVTLALALSAGPALADRAAGDNCAANLTPAAKIIYQDTAPDIKPETDLRDAIRNHTRQLVIDGKLDRDGARDAAQAAGGCLKAIKD
jgi:hypothetical protein